MARPNLNKVIKQQEKAVDTDINKIDGLVKGRTSQGFKGDTSTVFQNVDDYQSYINPEEKEFKGFDFTSAKDKSRAINQGAVEQVANAAVKFIPNVALEITKQVGNIFDIEDYANSDNEVGNWLSNWAEGQKQGINEEYNVYQENPDKPLDFGDFGWWVQNGSSLAESITAFAAVGYATGGAALAGYKNGANALKALRAIGKGTDTAKASRALAGITNAVLLNHAEGAGIAANVYNDLYKQKLQEFDNEGIADADTKAKEFAAEKAASVINVNRANILLNLTSAFAFLKVPALTRQARLAPSLAKSGKIALLEGSQEAVEESVNMIAENQARKEDYGASDILDDVVSAKGAENALLGFVGGAGQTALTNGGRKLKIRKDSEGRTSDYIKQTQAYEQQQANKTKLEALTKDGKLSDNTDAFMRTKESLLLIDDIQESLSIQEVSEKGSKEYKDAQTKIEGIQDKMLANQAYDAFDNGNAEHLVNIFEEVKKLTEDEAETKGLDKKTYREQAISAIEYIEDLENGYNVSKNYVNSNNVYQNRSTNSAYKRRKKQLETKLVELQKRVTSDLGDLGVVDYSFENDNVVIGDSEITSGVLKDIEKFDSVKAYKGAATEIKALQTKQTALGEQYLELISSTMQKDIKAKIKASRKKDRAVASANKIREKQATKKAAKRKQTDTLKGEQATTAKDKGATVTPVVDNADTTDTVTPPVSDTTGESIVSTNAQFAPLLKNVNRGLSLAPTLEKKLAGLNAFKQGLTTNPAISQQQGVDGILAQVNNIIQKLENQVANTEARSEEATASNSVVADKANALVDLLKEADTVAPETDADLAPLTEDEKTKINAQIDALNDLQDSLGDTTDINDFPAVARILSNIVGEDEFMSVFNKFKAVYILTNNKDVKETYIDIFYNKEQKQKVINNENILKNNRLSNEFYSLTETEFESNRKDIIKDFVESQGNTVYSKDILKSSDKIKVINAVNKIAHLDKKYLTSISTKATDKFNVLEFVTAKEELDNTLNSNASDMLLDPAILNEGSEIEFVVLNEQVYDDGTIVTSDGLVIKDGAETQRTPEEVAPIAISYNGEVVSGAFLHTTDWVNEGNIAFGQDVKAQKELLRQIRQTVLAATDQRLKTKITKRNDGWLLKDRQGKQNSVQENLPKVEIAIGRDGMLFNGERSTVQTNNKEIRNGIPYVIIPTNTNRQFGVPVQPNKLKDHPEYIDSIIEAVQIYMTNNPEDTRVSKVFDATELNLTKLSDLQKYVQKFVHTAKLSDNTFEGFKELISTVDDTKSIIRFTGNSIDFGRGLNVADTTRSINRQNIKDKKTLDTYLEKLRNVLSNNTYVSIDKNNIGKDFVLPLITKGDVSIISKPYNTFAKEHMKTDLYGHTLDNGKTIYTIQSSFEFDTSFALKETAPEVVVEAKPTVENTTTANDNEYDFDIESDEDFDIDDLAPSVRETKAEGNIKGAVVDYKNAQKIIDHLSKKYSIEGELKSLGLFNSQGVFFGETLKISINKDTTYDKDGNLTAAFKPTGFVKRATIFHEYIHPFVQIVEEHNEELYDALYEEALKVNEATPFTDISHYTEEKKKEELVVRYLDRLSVSDIVPNLLQRFLSFLSNIFHKKAVNNKATVKALSKDTTVEELYNVFKGYGNIKEEVAPIVLKSGLKGDLKRRREAIKKETDPEVIAYYQGEIDAIVDKLSSFDLAPKTLTAEQEAEFKATTPESLILQGISYSDQQTIINHLAANIVKGVVEKQSSADAYGILDTFGNTINNVALPLYKEKLADAVASGNTKAITAFTKQVTRFENISAQYGKLVNLALNKVKYTNSIAADAQAIDVIQEAIDDEVITFDLESEDGILKEHNNWEDDGVFREDIKSKMSANVKNMFSYIEDAEYDAKGFTKPKKGLLGIKKTIAFDTVVNELTAILAYNNYTSTADVVAPTFDSMLAQLEKWADSKPYFHNILERLDAATASEKNEFVSVMHKHYTHHIYVYNNEKGQSFVNDSDGNSVVNILLDEWYNNIYNSPLVESKEGVTVINKDTVNTIKNNIKDMVTRLKAKENVSVDEVQALFSSMGVELPLDVTKRIVTEGIKYKQHPYSVLALLTNADGVFKVLADRLTIIKGKNVEEHHPFADNSVLRQFARVISKYNPVHFASSFRDVRNRSYYGYSQNKFLIDRFKTLKTDKALLGQLANQPYSSTSNWVTELLDDNSNFKDYFEYFTFDGASSFDNTSKKLDTMSPAEIESSKLSLFFSSTLKNDKNYIVKLFYPTTSNKSVQYGVQTKGRNWGKLHPTTKNLSVAQLNAIFDSVVLPEILRIQDLQDDPTRHDIKAYADGGTMFNHLPALNGISSLWDIDGTERKLKADVATDPALRHAINVQLHSFINELVNDKLALWKKYGFHLKKEVNEKGVTIDVVTDTLKHTRNKIDPSTIREEAFSFVINYLIGDVNMYQTFITDPAFYFKSNQWKNVLGREGVVDTLIEEGIIEDAEQSKSLKRKDLLNYYTVEDFKQEHDDVFNNVGKRLAADAAPGIDIPDSPDNEFNMAFMADSERPAYLGQYLKALLGDDASEYNSANSTDAEEFTTLQEHLYVMVKQGKIDEGIMKRILAADKKGTKLTDAQKQVLNPMKPVYVNNVWRNGREHRIYVKSSSFPLYRELTKGLELDKLRKAMESQSIDRVAFDSAVKIGKTIESNTIYQDTADDLDNTGKLVDTIDLSNMHRLPRQGFKIQQDTPYDPAKDNINDGTQQIKLITANIKHIEGFKVTGSDESFTGQEIQDKLDNAYQKMFKIQHDNLANRLGYDSDTGSLNMNALSELLQEEARGRNYSLNDIEGLKLKEGSNGEFEFVVPLWLQGNSSKLESMLNSIVDNKVRKIKPRGKSYILGTSEGFRPIKEGVDSQDEITNTTGIVWDKDWYSRTDGQLQPMVIKDKNNKFYGEKGFDSESSFVQYAEVLVPFKFRDNDGNLLSASDFITEEGFIDTTKLAPELLNVFGFRIPTQYLNSMSAIKIVGFLPKESGDLVLAPADFTVQMGSDFDVDKLYSNSYNTAYDGTTLTKFTSEEDSLKALENEVLDLHFSVLGNPNPEVQKKILKPLDFGQLKNKGEDLIDKVFPHVSSFKKGMGMTEAYQTFKYQNARAGKIGIGVFSNDNTFISSVQGKNIYLQEKVGKGYEESVLELGGRKSNRISEPNVNTKGSKRTKTDVISAFQSLAVDDENEQGLFKLNINKHTFDAIRTLVMSGFEEDVIIYLINQPIVRRHVELTIDAEDSITPFKEADIFPKLTEEFPASIDSEVAVPNITLDTMYNNLTKEVVDNVTQRHLYNIFAKVTNQGKSIQTIQSAINTHSAGVGKNLFYSSMKEQQLLGLGFNINVANVKNLIGNYFRIQGDIDITKNVVVTADADEEVNKFLAASIVEWVGTNDELVKADIINRIKDVGYVPVTPVRAGDAHAQEISFIKPTTINGFPSVDALLFNNSLWSKFFPYNTKGIKEVLNDTSRIISSSSVEGDSIAAKASKNDMIFKEVKSYITSGKVDLLTEGEIVSERNRLLIDTTDNMSLGTILTGIIKDKGLSNEFINRLQIVPKKAVLPTTISYNAAKAENVDELPISTAIVSMLSNTTRDLGTYNGIPYTPSKLMQDLITYQYITGGVQKSKQFIKYIPLNYLNTLGFYDALNKVDFSVSDDFNQYRFKNQILQHNPDKVRLNKLQTSSLTANYKYTDKGTRIIRSNPTTVLLPPIFSVPYKGAVSGFKLFVYDESSNTHMQKDTLGLKDILEYDTSKDFANTIIAGNKTPVVTEPTVPTTPKDKKDFLQLRQPSTDSEVIYDSSALSNVEYFDLTSQGATKERLGYIMNKIINNSTNAFNSIMAKEVVNNLDRIKDYRFVVSNTLQAKGSFSLKNKTIMINPTQIKTREEFEDIILEEVIHSLTKESIIANNTGEVARLKGLRNVAEVAVKKHITSLGNDANTAFAEVSRKVENGIPLTVFEDTIIYPLINETEFVGRLFKSKKLQEILNDIPSTQTSGKTVLDDIFDFIIKALNAVGLNINRGSALEYSIKDIISLINQAPPTTNIQGEISKANPSYMTIEAVEAKFGIVDSEGFLREFRMEKAKEIATWINTNINNLEAEAVDNFVSVKNKVIQTDIFGTNIIVNKSLKYYELKDIPVYSNKGINTMRKQGYQHFGNLFTGTVSVANKNPNLILMDSVAEAVEAYKKWLIGENLNNILGKYLTYDGVLEAFKQAYSQRDWILSQIKEGKLNNATLLYMSDRKGYKSHADVLKEVVEEQAIDLAPATEEEFNKAGALIKSLNNRIATITKNIQKAEAADNFEKSEQLKSILNSLQDRLLETSKSTSLAALHSKGLQDMQEVGSMLNSSVTLEDTLYIRKVIHFWKKGIDLLFDAEDRQSDQLVDLFNELAGQAEKYNDELKVIENKYVNKLIKQYGSDMTVSDIFTHFKDINGMSATTLDISRSGNVLLDSAFLLVKDANVDAIDESKKISKKLESLESNIQPILKRLGSKEPYEVFRQKTKNGKLTGHLVSRYTNNFNKGLNSALRRLNRDNTSHNFINLLEWANKNTKSVNLNYLIPINPLEGQDAIDAETYKEELKAELGATHYAEFIAEQSRLINKYNKNLAAKYRNLVGEYDFKTFKDFTSNKEAVAEYQNWIETHSPYEYYKFLETSIPERHSNTNNFNNANFVNFLPINEKLYDENFKTIENNPDLSAFYKYYNDVITELKEFLPEDTRRDLAYNGVPYLEKSILDLYKDKGMKVGLAPIWDAVRKSVRSVEDSVIIKKNIDPVTDKEERALRIGFSKDKSEAIKNYLNKQTIDYVVKHKEQPSPATILEWKEDITDRLAQDQDYDLAKILRVYALTTLAYKHKSKIEDSILLTQNILNNQKELNRTGTGKVQYDNVTGEVSAKNPEHSFTNTKKQYDSFVDNFYGVLKKEEGKTDQKILTKTEKADKATIKAQLTELEESFNKGEIDGEDYGHYKAVLETQLEEMGGYAVWSKRGDNVLKWVQLVKMGWNLPSSVANIGFGFISNYIEAAGGTLYTTKQLTDAYRLVGHSVLKNGTFNKFETETAQKIRSVMDNWDVLKDASHELFESPFDVSLHKEFKWLSPYNVTQRTEYVNQAPLLLAMMMNTKIEHEGKTINLWEGYNKKGEWDSEKYGEIPTDKIAPIVKNLRHKVDQLNKMNHGNYDPISVLGIKSHLLGRAISQFRTWMFEGWAVRTEGYKVDPLLGERKGRYRSAADFFKEHGAGTTTKAVLQGLVRSGSFKAVLKNADFDQYNTDNLKDVDIANMRKLMSEALMYVGIYTSYLILRNIAEDLDDEEDKNTKFLVNTLINQGSRLKTDIIFYLNPAEFKNLLKDLIPATSVIVDATKFIGSVSDFIQGEDEITTGVNAGGSKLLRDASKALPLGSPIYKTFNYGKQTFDK